MATTITNYKIFVGSPSDLADERSAIKEVIDELNLTTGSRNNFRIELVLWETHSAPGADKKGVQSRINKDIGNDYDLFIGLLWTKFGTPTSKFASGTAEEFALAKKRFDKSPQSVQVLVYFKDASPANLRDIDPGELQKINTFRKSLGNEGVLYWNFGSIAQLQAFLRLHVPLRIETLKKGRTRKKASSRAKGTSKAKKKPNAAPLVVHEDDEDLGTLDYQDIITEALGESTSALFRVTEATKNVGSGVEKIGKEITHLNKSKPTPSGREVRSLLQRAATVMNSYADQLKPDSDLFLVHFERGIKATTRLATLLSGPSNSQDKQVLIGSFKEMVGSMEKGLKGFRGMLSAVENLPRLEKELNRSRRRVEEHVRDFLSKLEVARRLSNELIEQLESQ